jgi:hypothetical protein
MNLNGMVGRIVKGDGWLRLAGCLNYFDKFFCYKPRESKGELREMALLSIDHLSIKESNCIQ